MLLSNANINFLLKRKDFYISSFGGFFVLGIVRDNIFQVFIKLNSFDFELFYNNLRLIIEFLTNDDKTFSSLKYIKEKKNEKYSWEGIIENETKMAIIYIEKLTSSEKTNFFLNEITAEAILISLPSIYFSSLILKENQKFFLSELSKQKLESIELMKKEVKFMLPFYKSFNKIFPEANLFDNYQLFLFHYNEILIVSEINMLS